MATLTWAGTTGNWTDPTQWKPGLNAIPQPGDTALINAGAVTLTGIDLQSQTVDLGGVDPTITLIGSTLDTHSVLSVASLSQATLDIEQTTQVFGTLSTASPYTEIAILQGNATLPAQFVVSGTLDASAYTDLILFSGGNFMLDGTLNVSGQFTAESASASNTFTNDGTINCIAPSGTFVSFSANMIGTGVINVDASDKVFLAATTATQTLNLNAGNADVMIGPSFAGNIVGFRQSDTLSLNSVVFTSLTYDPTTEMLYLYDDLAPFNISVLVATLHISGSYQTADFSILPFNTITTDVTCFAEGTRIATDQGEIPIEYLRPGQLCHTPNGLRPIVWIGRRRVNCSRHPQPRDVWPVRIRAGTFGRHLPQRDLVLSPNHCVFIQGVLIPVRELVNARSIVQEQTAEITYWHIELSRHDVILAEGLSVESYIDNDTRDDFDDAIALRLHPTLQGSHGASELCAPLVRQGPVLQQVFAELVQRASQLRPAA
jgi:hypothetical protein